MIHGNGIQRLNHLGLELSIFKDTIWVDVDYRGRSDTRHSGNVISVYMNVAMQQIARTKSLYEKSKYLESAVSQIGSIVYTIRWRVGDQNVKVPTVSDTAPQK